MSDPDIQVIEYNPDGSGDEHSSEEEGEFTSPQIQIDADKDHEKSEDMDSILEDGLDIRPPQTQTQPRTKKMKKKDKERRKNDSRHKDRDKHRHRDKDRNREKDEKKREKDKQRERELRPFMEEKERKTVERKDWEKEERRRREREDELRVRKDREISFKDRERLERLEREQRLRERLLRAERERKKREEQQRQEEERQRERRRKEKYQERDARKDRLERRSRSREKQVKEAAPVAKKASPIEVTVVPERSPTPLKEEQEEVEEVDSQSEHEPEGSEDGELAEKVNMEEEEPVEQITVTVEETQEKKRKKKHRRKRKETTSEPESESDQEPVAEEGSEESSAGDSTDSESSESESDSSDVSKDETDEEHHEEHSPVSSPAGIKQSKYESDHTPSDQGSSHDIDYLDDSPPTSPVDLAPQLPPYYPAVQGCRSVEEFHCLNRIEEGTYGVVYRAKDKKSNEIVALKRLKMEKEKEGFPITSLREINTLLKAQHPNIVTVREIVVGSNMDKIYIVMDYVEHDLKSLMETMKNPFLVGEVKTLLLQLLRAVVHLHDNWILHRDLKTSNLLLSHKGILKVGDFGLAREYGSPLKHYTPIVVTLWYRAPELLLGVKEYSTKIDMWSVGCIFAELLLMKPLFPGKSEIDQLNRIFKDLGTPSEKIWTGYNELPAVKKCTFVNYPYNTLRSKLPTILSDNGFDLLNRFLTYDPKRRIPADEALTHTFFSDSPLPVEPSMFPTWPAKSEQMPRKRGSSPKPPSGGKNFKDLGDDMPSGGFHIPVAQHGVSKTGIGFNLKF